MSTSEKKLEDSGI